MNQPPPALWQPDGDTVARARITHYMAWLAKRGGPVVSDYHALWQWSVDELDDFWRSIVEYFDVQVEGDTEVVLVSEAMPGAQWFPGLRLNYAEQVFAAKTDASPAIVACSEGEGRNEADVAMDWPTLRAQTAALAHVLRQAGVKPGDRVAAYLPNRPETVVGFLAAASIGAVWSSCAPEMGADVVVDRFGQIAPKVLIATDSYRYNGRLHSRTAQVEALLQRLPSVRLVLHVPGPQDAGAAPLACTWRDSMSWREALSAPAPPLIFERVAFDHPLWIVYSSGTTGLPKAMVHSHGGIVLTHLKTMALQHDLHAGDRIMFLGSPGWIVWNLLVGGLLVGATIVLHDGQPNWQGHAAFWRRVERLGLTHLGSGAAFLIDAMNSGVRPGEVAQLSKLRAMISTGSPLPDPAYHWVYEAVKRDVWLASVSGGTDIASGFVACCPLLPVHAGEIQCRELGVAAQAFDEAGRVLHDAVGELVVTRPMPSMPVRFWNDAGDARYRESYFETYRGIWRHGDWIRFTSRGSCVIYGRSDATINRHGIRMGTAEIYRVVEELDEVHDSLAVDLEYLGRPSFMLLFVTLADGQHLGDALQQKILQQVRAKASPRHVPDAVIQVDEIPRTLTGKKMEVPVRKLLLGHAPESVARPETMLNPASLAFFEQYARRLADQATGIAAKTAETAVRT